MDNNNIEKLLNESLDLQKENNILLKKIYKILSNNSDLKEFGINVAANFLVEFLKNNN